MANIRKTVEAPKIAPQQQKQPTQPAGPSLDDVTKAIDKAIDNDRNFSQSEVKRLEEMLKGAPKPLIQAARDHLTSRLENEAKSAQGPIAISEQGLSALSRLVGVDLKDLFFRRQLKSEKVDRSVTQGLDKTAETVADSHDVEKQKAKSDNRLEKQKALRDQKEGVVNRPVGGGKGAAYDAATVLADHLEAQLDLRLGPEAKALKDELRGPIMDAASKILVEMKASGSLDGMGDVLKTIGTPAFKETLANTAGQVGKDVLKATNMELVNTDAVAMITSRTASAVERLTQLTKGTQLEASVAKHGGAVAKAVGDAGSKLTSLAKGAQTAEAATKGAQAATTVAKGAQAATTVAKGAQAATAVAEGAQAATAVAEGAQAVAQGAQAATAVAKGAATGAAGASQIAPGAQQIAGGAFTVLSLGETIAHCKHKPPDAKRIIASGLNTLLQGVGVVVPFVGAFATFAKMGVDKAFDANDKKHGKEPYHASILSLFPHAEKATSIASPLLEGAGYPEAAGKAREYTSYLKQMGEKGVSSTDWAKLDQAQRDAMIQEMAAAHQEMEKLRSEVKGTPFEASLTLLGAGFQQLMAIWRKTKNVPNAADPEAEAKKLQGEAMEALAKGTAAQAIMDHTSTDGAKGA